MINLHKSLSMNTAVALISYFQIYVSMFTSVILFFFPNLISYKIVVLIVSSVSAITLSVLLLSGMIKWKKILMTLFVCLIIVGGYLLTKYDFAFSNDRYNSFFLVLIGQVTPTILCAAAVAQLPDTQYQIKRMVPLVGAIFTLIAFMAAFFPSGATTGGFVDNQNNLNYQSTSYLAAYASGFNLYYLISYKTVNWHRFFKLKIIFYLFASLVVVNLLTILISGGRGGLVLYLVQLGFAFWYAYKYCQEIIPLRRIVGMIFVIILMGLFAINFALNYQGETNGISRIIDTVVSHDTNGRNELREMALQIHKKSPIIGHGLGSVFYLVGIYTHNCLVDSLVEGGYIGCFLYAFFIILTFNKCNRLIFLDQTNSLWTIILLDGFVMSLFSGYYIAQIPIDWVLTFSLSKSPCNI